jgi:hypothetical protein
MTLNFLRPSALCSFVLAACLPAAAEDLTLVQTVTKDNNPPATATSYISSDRLRMISADGNEVLAELGAGKFTVIDNKKKEYYVVTKQDLQAVAAAMQASTSQMPPQLQEQMKNMPPEMREKMAGLMGAMAPAINVQKGTGSRTIAGYRCDNWTITIGEMSRTEQCLSTDLQFPVQAWDAYQDFANSMKSAMTAGPMGQVFAQMQEKFKDLKGFPLASNTTTKIMGRSSTSSNEITEIKKGPVPASAWQIPADYKQAESPMAKLAKQK